MSWLEVLLLGEVLVEDFIRGFAGVLPSERSEANQRLYIPRYECPMGNKVRESREEAGLSQSELATRSGVAQPNIAAYESGDVELRLGCLSVFGLLPALSRTRLSLCTVGTWRPAVTTGSWGTRLTFLVLLRSR